jgi:hypothetical protein
VAVRDELTLDQARMLGPDVHLVCCEYEAHGTPIMSFCGLDVTSDPYRPEAATTCVVCVERTESGPVTCAATGDPCPHA